MRADRLLSLLMLLQTRGRLTAQALADELEVSVRTVYRDIEALSSAGVPVYADRGPGGGCALVDNYHTRLTGLHEGEVRALFMATMPTALAELGMGAELKAALLKLLAALPAERQHDDQWVRQRIYLDWESRQRNAAPAGNGPVQAGSSSPPILQTLQQGVWNDRRLWITYRRESSFYRRQFERRVDPYGLVAKEGIWHLVCAASSEPGDRLRFYKVAELVAVRTTGEPFARPAGFDLQQAWHTWCERIRQDQGRYTVLVRVSPQMYVDLPLVLGEHLESKQNGDGEEPAQTAGTDVGWVPVTLHFDSLEEARTKLLGLGAGVEVMTPVALRRSLLDYAQQVINRYSRH
jgi:predicted DNA-binding transcriptional regulator YafY